MTPEALHALLATGADLDQADASGTTPLMHALASSAKAAEKKRLVTAFIKAGANLEARDGQGRSPLDLAVSVGSLPLIRLLVARGADPNGRDPEGRTTLMKLCPSTIESKVYKVVSTLVELGADPNAQCSRGRTPIMYAALGADPLGMPCYALQGVHARVDLLDVDGKNVIELCMVGNPRMLPMLRRNLAEQTGAEHTPAPATPGPGGFLPPG